jgi:hypothetical protein
MKEDDISAPNIYRVGFSRVLIVLTLFRLRPNITPSMFMELVDRQIDRYLGE